MRKKIKRVMPIVAFFSFMLLLGTFGLIENGEMTIKEGALRIIGSIFGLGAWEVI